MIKFTGVTPQGKQQITAKTNWEELTLEEFIKIETIAPGKISIIEMFSILSGLHIDVISGTECEEIERQLFEICAGIQKNAPDFKELKPPKKLLIDGKVYDSPLKFNNTMLGQKILLKQLIVDSKKQLLNIIPEVIAIYFQPLMDGKFDDQRIEPVKKLLLQSPALHCYALAQFFFLHSPYLNMIGLRNFKQYQSQKESKTAKH